MIYDEIIKIEEIGIEETIDISVDGNNLFFANDILTHNSGSEKTAQESSMSDTSDCLYPLSLVDHKTKGKIFLKDLIVGDEILGKNGYVQVQRVFEPKLKRAYKIKMKSGQEIICSADHDFPVNGDRNRIKKIKIGLKQGEILMVK